MSRLGAQVRAPEKQLSNQGLVTIAVFLLGGVSAPVDTEDIAIKANELAPGRFSWRRHKDQINIETVRKRLWDAKRSATLAGSEKTGWTLTQQGLQFARRRLPSLGFKAPAQARLSLKERQWRAAERRRLLGSEAFEHFRKNGNEGVQQREAEAFFRLDDYVVGDLRERKIVRIIAAFADDAELGEAVMRWTPKVGQNLAVA
jgi:hypothetical protein